MRQVGSLWYPRGVNPWPADAVQLTPVKVQELYESGFAGAAIDYAAREAFEQQYPKRFEDIAHAFNLADIGKDKLVMPFVFVLDMFPGCSPGAAQQRGDCVSHSEAGAALMAMVGDIMDGVPDEQTGEIEGVPELPVEGIKDGVTSTEAFYWYRGYNGDGWSCEDAVDVATSRGGLMLRKPYPELGIDLTRYSGGLAGKYGSKAPPAEITAEAKRHPCYGAARASTYEAVRDALANVHGLTTCGGEGYSSKRDEFAMSPRQGGWSHGYPFWGVDDRPIIREKFGEGLVLNRNNWGEWNSGPRDIYQSASLVPPHLKEQWIARDIVNASTGNIMVPRGCWFCRWRDCKNRSIIVHAGVKGWKRKALPNYGTFIWG